MKKITGAKIVTRKKYCFIPEYPKNVTTLGLCVFFASWIIFGQEDRHVSNRNSQEPFMLCVVERRNKKGTVQDIKTKFMENAHDASSRMPRHLRGKFSSRKEVTHTENQWVCQNSSTSSISPRATRSHKGHWVKMSSFILFFFWCVNASGCLDKIQNGPGNNWKTSTSSK